MSNTNSQIDGLGSFNQSAQNAGTIKYGAFLNASKNLGTIALSAVFGNTSINQGTIGDVLPIVTASIVQQNSGNWDSTYTTVMQNSAMWALSGGGITENIINDVVNSVINTDSFVLTTDPRLSDIPFGIDAYNTIQANSASWSLTGDTTNSPEWDAVTSFVKSNSGSLVYTNDSRLADTPNGNAALTYIRSNSADFVFDNDSRLSNARTPVSHNHDASAITSGTLDVARLPVIPSQEQVLITGVMYTSASQYFGGDDHFTDKTDSINQGTIVTTTDGYRWVYTGSGNKRYNTSYVLLADITPEWSAIANKPASFPVDGHTHDIADVTNLQSSLNNLQSNIDGKQASGNYALATDPRFTVLATNSAQWGDGTVQGYNAYTYVHQNSASLVLTNDSRLSDSRTPLTHTHDISEVTGLQSSLDGKASVASVSTKANLSAFDGLNTLVQENSGTWEGVGIVYNYFRATSAAAVYSDDIRLAKANTAYSYLTGASASIVTTSVLNSAIAGAIFEGDSRLSDARTPLAHTHDASSITSGKLDVDRIPVLPSLEVVVVNEVMYDNNAFFNTDENTVIDGFTYVLSAIGKGTVVTTTDGNRFVYKGEGGKRFANSYIQLADITPEWSAVSNKPSTFTPESHTHAVSEVVGLLPITSLVISNSSLWESSATQSQVAYTYVNTNSANTVMTSDSRLTRANTSYTYLTANSASIVMTSDSRLGNAATTYSYVTANSANIVMTSDSRLANASTTYSYVTANSANTVMTSDSRLTRANTSYTYLTANSASIVMTSDSRLTNASTAYTSVQSNSATWAVGATGSINYTIDGGGTAIATGSKGYVQVPNNFIIQEWSIIADLQTTSFIVDVRRSTYANIPTTTSIVGSDFLKLTNQQKNRNLSVSWSNVSAGDLIEFFVTGASNASMINISLKGIRS